MQRRSFLRACGVATVAGLAGCQNPEAAVEGEVLETVDGLAVTDHFGDDDDGFFEVEMDVENTGGATADLGNYEFTVVPFDENDDDITEMRGTTRFDNRMLQSGETTEVEVEVETTSHPADVERYEIRITCSEFAEDAAYCDG